MLKKDQEVINCYVGVSKQCKHRYNAKKIIEELNIKFSSKGGGSPTFGSSVILNQDINIILDYISKSFIGYKYKWQLSLKNLVVHLYPASLSLKILLNKY